MKVTILFLCLSICIQCGYFFTSKKFLRKDRFQNQLLHSPVHYGRHSKDALQQHDINTRVSKPQYTDPLLQMISERMRRLDKDGIDESQDDMTRESRRSKRSRRRSRGSRGRRSRSRRSRSRRSRSRRSRSRRSRSRRSRSRRSRSRRSRSRRSRSRQSRRYRRVYGIRRSRYRRSRNRYIRRSWNLSRKGSRYSSWRKVPTRRPVRVRFGLKNLVSSSGKILKKAKNLRKLKSAVEVLKNVKKYGKPAVKVATKLATGKFVGAGIIVAETVAKEFMRANPGSKVSKALAKAIKYGNKNKILKYAYQIAKWFRRKRDLEENKMQRRSLPHINDENRTQSLTIDNKIEKDDNPSGMKNRGVQHEKMKNGRLQSIV